MEWLEDQTVAEQGIESLSWTVRCLAPYGRSFERMPKLLAERLTKAAGATLTTATLALTLLALRCEEMIHPFIVSV